jgi:hypothetical protein
MRAGFIAFRASNLPAAISDFQRAAGKRPASGVPWVWIGKSYLQTGQTQGFSQAWDKALKLGETLLISSCYIHGFHSCDRGDLSLRPKSVTFRDIQKRTLFDTTPSQVETTGVHKGNAFTGNTSFRLRVKGKNYNFNFLPLGVKCFVKFVVQCPSQGLSQQLVVANYVEERIPKLASGTFAVSPPQPPSQSSAAAPTTSGAGMTSSGQIPPPIRAILDREYPGWKPVATSAEYLKACKPPNPGFKYWFVYGDFNGDSQRDYAAEVVQGTTGYLIAFLAGDGGFLPVVAQTFPGARLTWPVLGVAPKGASLPDLKSASNGGFVINHRIIPTDALLGFACGKSGEAYLYSNSRFESFFTSD